jgi:hypothetical protein
MVIVKCPDPVARMPANLPSLLFSRADSFLPFSDRNFSVTIFPQKDFICGR